MREVGVGRYHPSRRALRLSPRAAAASSGTRAIHARWMNVDRLLEIAAIEVALSRARVAESRRAIEHSRKVIADISAIIENSRTLVTQPTTPGA